jgi:hypothetical protein
MTFDGTCERGGGVQRAPQGIEERSPDQLTATGGRRKGRSRSASRFLQNRRNRQRHRYWASCHPKVVAGVALRPFGLQRETTALSERGVWHVSQGRGHERRSKWGLHRRRKERMMANQQPLWVSHRAWIETISDLSCSRTGLGI